MSLGVEKLSRPYSLSPGWFWGIFLVSVALSYFLRTYEIDLRPLHNDEAVNWHFVKQSAGEGFYRYSHQNYHGPLYFYLTWLFVSIFGETEFGLRFSAIILGVLSPFLLLPLRKYEGDSFVLISAFGIALSSSLVFYSRYAIHETLFAFSTLGLAVSAYVWFLSRNKRHLYFCGLFLACLIATKETFIISLFCLFFAFCSLGNPYKNFKEILTARHFAGGLLLCVLLIVFCFTGGLQWSGGLREMLLAVPQWIGRNESDVGHWKPFWTYGKIIWKTEPVLLLSLVFPLLLLVSYPKSLPKAFGESARFGRFAFVWAGLTFLVYSYVSYKTPWLLINVTIPVVILIAWLISRCEKWLQIAVTALMLLLAGRYAWTYNFDVPFGSKNEFSYVQTSFGLIELVSDIEHLEERLGRGAKVLVGVQGSWPLPYYFRSRKNVPYQVTTEPESFKDRFDVLILDRKVDWLEPGWVKKYYRLSDVQESHTYFKRPK